MRDSGRREKVFFAHKSTVWFSAHSKKARKKRQAESDEVKPSFNGGGPNAFAKWVNSRLQYPVEASGNKIKGATVLQFTITATGELTDIRIIRSSGSTALDMEAIRVVSEFPAWEPGTQSGKIKSMTLTFPVIFSLNK